MLSDIYPIIIMRSELIVIDCSHTVLLCPSTCIQTFHLLTDIDIAKNMDSLRDKILTVMVSLDSYLTMNIERLYF